MYANIVSTFAAVAAAGGLWLHWQRWRHDQRTKSLIVRAEIKPDEDAKEGWQKLFVTFRSRADTGYKAERLRILWPPSGRVAGWWICHKDNPEGPMHGHVFSAPESPGRSTQIGLAVAHARQQAHRESWGGLTMGTGDTHSEEFYVKRRGSGRLIIAIDITPEDDSERPFTRRKWLNL
jgi:hypothetical protein